MGKGASQTTNAQPWSGAIPGLTLGNEEAARLYNQNRIGPVPFLRDRVANLTPQQIEGMGAQMNAARGMSPLIDGTQYSVSQMMAGANGVPQATGQAAQAGLGAIMGDINRGGAQARITPQAAAQGLGADFRSGGDAQNVLSRNAAVQGGRDAALTNQTMRGLNDMTYRDLDAVKQNVLGSVIPQVSSIFSDTGGLDSSAAMDTIGRAASEAIAPIEYGAYNDAMSRNAAMLENATNRSLGAMTGNADRDFAGRQAMLGRAAGFVQDDAARNFAGNQAALGRGLNLAGMSADMATRGATLAPTVAGMQMMPGQIMQGVGGAIQGQRQNEIGGLMQTQQEMADREYNILARMMSIINGTAGMGGTTTQTGGPSQGQQAVGGALSGAATGAMIGGPYGALAGGGLGLLGAFL